VLIKLCVELLSALKLSSTRLLSPAITHVYGHDETESAGLYIIQVLYNPISGRELAQSTLSQRQTWISAHHMLPLSIPLKRGI